MGSPGDPPHTTGTLRLVLVGLAVVAAAASWYPFQVDPPRRLVNHAVRDGRVLHLLDVGVAEVPSVTSAVVAELLDDGAVSIDVSVRAAAGQDGPARILSLSRSIRDQTLVIGQSGGALVVRLAHPAAPRGVEQAVRIDGVFDGQRHDVAVRLGRRRLVVVVDGEATATRSYDAVVTGAWEPDHVLLLGNEHGATRPWIGRIDRAVLRSGSGVETDLVRASVVPPHVWRRPDGWVGRVAWYRPWSPSPSQLPHVALFAGLGWVAGAAFPGRRLRFLVAGLAEFTFVLLVVKFVVAGRHPSLADATVEVVAAGLGCLAARRRRAGHD